MKLTEQTIERIKEDKTVFIDIQKLLNTTEGTMYRHLRNNSPRLIGLDVLCVLSDRWNLPIEKLTTE